MLLYIPLEVDHHIHQVLQNFGAGHRALFGDVADQKQSDLLFLGLFEQSRRTFPNLAYIAGCAGKLRVVNRLHRIHYNHLRVGLFDVIFNLGDVGLGENQQIANRGTQAFGPILNLLLRFFATDIECFVIVLL